MRANAAADRDCCREAQFVQPIVNDIFNIHQRYLDKVMEMGTAGFGEYKTKQTASEQRRGMDIPYEWSVANGYAQPPSYYHKGYREAQQILTNITGEIPQ